MNGTTIRTSKAGEAWRLATAEGKPVEVILDEDELIRANPNGGGGVSLTARGMPEWKRRGL